MTDSYQEMLNRLHSLAYEAMSKTELQRLSAVHRQFCFNSGMSFWCMVCGARQQSLIPTDRFRHSPDCPLHSIQLRVQELGGWDLDWDIDREKWLDELRDKPEVEAEVAEDTCKLSDDEKAKLDRLWVLAGKPGISGMPMQPAEESLAKMAADTAGWQGPFPDWEHHMTEFYMMRMAEKAVGHALEWHFEVTPRLVCALHTLIDLHE